jgi:C4-dicarboxylate-binding protein DctP
VLYGKVGEMVRADVKQTMGVEALALGATGFRVFAGRKEIRNAADCRGIKLRVPEVPVFVEMGRALGANPTPIPAGEMYTALQAGVVDAVELPPDVVANFKLWEVAQHVTRTNHIFTEASIFASTTSTGMRGLSAQNWQIVREAGRRALEVDNWDLNLKAQTAAWQSLTERMKAVSDPDIASFREKTAPVIAGFTAKTGAKGKAFVEATMAA